MSWKYFNYQSDPRLACTCCGKRRMNPVFMEKLDKMREECGFPFMINSGYRCPKHNSYVSSTGLTGPHTTGRSADIKTNSRQRYMLMRVARKHGITRFGVGNGFTHIDDLTEEDGFDEDVIWSY